jgi:hypothetical protein
VVRTALAIRGPAFAERLIEGIQPVTPHTALVLASAQAALTEAGGDLTAAAEAYADAAARWEAFGMISEQAFALLGFGRSLVATGRVVEAQTALVRARGIFISLGAEPDLAEVEGLLMESTAT